MECYMIGWLGVSSIELHRSKKWTMKQWPVWGFKWRKNSPAVCSQADGNQKLLSLSHSCNKTLKLRKFQSLLLPPQSCISLSSFECRDSFLTCWDAAIKIQFMVQYLDTNILLILGVAFTHKSESKVYWVTRLISKPLRSCCKCLISARIRGYLARSTAGKSLHNHISDLIILIVEVHS